MSGPLGSLKVIEFAGMGPAPFCGMLLADLGADVICIDRPGPGPAACPCRARSTSCSAASVRSSWT